MEHKFLQQQRKSCRRRAGACGETADASPTGRRRVFPAACLVMGLGLVASSAWAADYPIAEGEDIAAQVSNTVAPGDVWQLNGKNFTIDSTINLPAGMSGNVVTGGLLIVPQQGPVTITSTLTSGSALSSGTNGDTWINVTGSTIFDGGNLNNTVTRGSLIYNGTTGGGANIYLGSKFSSGDITIQNFNTAYGLPANNANGGAIYSEGGEINIGTGSDKVTLSNNFTTGVGAVIYINSTSTVDNPITINGTDITIQGNEAQAHSGAIYTPEGNLIIGNSGSTVTVGDLTNAALGNTAAGSGGALQAAGGVVEIYGNAITIANNTTTNWGDGSGGSSTLHGSGGGGAILGAYGAIIGNADGSSVINISNNSAWTKGGAIYTSSLGRIGDVIITGRSITLDNNEAATTTDLTGLSAQGVGGGAIYANGDIELNGGAISLAGNKTYAGSGGALEADHSVVITGSMVASDNTALGTGALPGGGVSGYGGAIWAGLDVKLNAEGGNIEFRNNEASGDGGAIRAGGSVDLNAISGNIIFQGNKADSDGAGGSLGNGGKGDAIYIHSSYNNQLTNAELTFNAAAGRTITFYDSIANNTDKIANQAPSDGDYGTPPTVPGSAVAYDDYYLLPVLKTGAGAVIFDGADGDIYGETTVAGGTFVVRNNAVYGALLDAGNKDSSFTVNAGATLAGGGTDPNVRGEGEVRANSINIAGTIDISGSLSNLNDPDQKLAGSGNNYNSYSTFTLTGGTIDFVGGSAIKFNTYLGDDHSQTDLLILRPGNGLTTSGTALVNVNNTGGLGAKTDIGIKLVQYDYSDGALLVNALNPGVQFSLANRVAAGAWEYKLYQDGVTTDSLGGDIGDWYLRSSGQVRPEVPVDSVIPALSSRLGLGMLGTWHERRDGEFATNYAPEGYKYAGWGRVFGEIGSYGDNNLSSFNDHGSSYDYWFGALQIGMDVLRKENDNGSRDIAGFYLAIGTARANVDALYNVGYGSESGKVSMEGYSLGAYYTHIGQKGWYIDAVLQGTYFANIEAESYTVDPQTLNTDGWGLLASLEGGYPFALGNNWVFEPQAQLIYQHLDFGDDNDAFGQIGFSNSDSLYGRIAGRLAKDWTRDNGRKVNAWARASLWTSFGAQSETTFSELNGSNPMTFDTDLGGNWAQFDIGVSTQLSETVSLFLVGKYDVGFGSAGGDAWGGRAGLKIMW